jgi:glycosyltransferase involved in cell wall biosynthesis
MKGLTVIIVSKEDEDVIGDAIKSVKGFAEHILVIDGNRDDITRKAAEKLGAMVVRHQFKDFSDQRNFAILHAHTTWVLYLDSDERVTNEFKSEVERVIAEYDEFSAIGGYFIYRKTFYYGKDWHLQDKVQRLFLRNRFVEWTGAVHETPKIKGEFGVIQAPIEHYTHRNLSQMVRKTNEWSEYEAKLRFEKGHPPLVVWRFFRVMFTEFVGSYIKNKGYKNGTLGLIEAMYQAFSIYITYAKLWEMQKKLYKK